MLKLWELMLRYPSNFNTLLEDLCLQEVKNSSLSSSEVVDEVSHFMYMSLTL